MTRRDWNPLYTLRWDTAAGEQKTTGTSRDIEAAMLASFIREYIQHWFNESYQRKLAARPLDVDGGCPTIVFIKYGPDDWGYRVTTWQYGPAFVPPPPPFRERYPDEARGGPLSLLQVMDRKHTICEEPLPRWRE
ncbi:hypothetical protein [Streptomyces sp. NPDC093223]|uniref:hypothetical protein n=1 Tax=Streptomyces sp. NPDC093223 TaxID=3366033 RepID=UPI00381A1821